MTKPTYIKIDGYKYYDANEVYDFDTPFFNGCLKSSRLIIEKKKLEENNYIYAYKKGDEMIVSTSSYKKAKLFLSKKWTENNVPKFMENGSLNDYEIPPAPEEIFLNEDQKFKDEKGNLLKIEMRGDRNYEGCFFKVKDVSEAFGIPSLYDSLIDQRTSYKLNIHYKYFNINKSKNNKNTIKKELYLTVIGFKKILEVSKNNITEYNKEIIFHWLMYVCKKSNKKYDFILKIDKQYKNEGYVYCVSSPILQAVKIGFCRGTEEGLKQRYITSYGSNLDLYLFKTNHPYKLEQQTHKYFNKYNISMELFEKKYLKKYIEYIENNII